MNLAMQIQHWGPVLHLFRRRLWRRGKGGGQIQHPRQLSRRGQGGGGSSNQSRSPTPRERRQRLQRRHVNWKGVLRRYRSQRLAEHVDRWELAGDWSHGDAFRVAGAGRWQNNGVLLPGSPPLPTRSGTGWSAAPCCTRCSAVSSGAGGGCSSPGRCTGSCNRKAYYSQLVIKLSRRENQDSTRAYYVVPVSKIYSPAGCWRAGSPSKKSAAAMTSCHPMQ